MRPKSRVQYKTVGPQDKFRSLVGLCISWLPTPLCKSNLYKMEGSCCGALECILEPLRNDEEFTSYRGQHRDPAQATRSSILLMSPLVGRTRFIIPKHRLSLSSRHRLMLSCRRTPSHPDMTVCLLILRYRQYQRPIAPGYPLWLNECFQSMRNSKTVAVHPAFQRHSENRSNFSFYGAAH